MLPGTGVIERHYTRTPAIIRAILASSRLGPGSLGSRRAACSHDFPRLRQPVAIGQGEAEVEKRRARNSAGTAATGDTPPPLPHGGRSS